MQAIGGESARWGDTEHLLANLVDLAATHAWMFLTANSKPPRPPAPTPIERPGQKRPTQGLHIGGNVAYPLDEIDRIIASARPKQEVTSDGN